MLKYLANYTGNYEDDLNVELMTKAADRPLVEYVVDAWKSLEVVKYIKFLGYEWCTSSTDIDINKHVFKRYKKVPKKLQYDYKMINNDRVGRLTVHMLITIPEKDPKTHATIIRQKEIHKDMLVPIPDDQGYLWINGRKYYMIYQLVEKSTYTTLTSAVIKSLMPITIKRVCDTFIDTDGHSYILPYFNTFVFHRETDIMLFFAANFGLRYTLVKLQISAITYFLRPEDERKEGYLYFQISKYCLIGVVKEMFDKYTYVQAMVAGILHILNSRFNYDDLDNPEPFIKKLSPSLTLEKGRDTLTSFNRMLDETTKKILMVDDYHTQDVYAVIRWAMMEFNHLRMKDNMSLENKRLRCNEYIAALLTQEFSTRLNRIINLGSKATLENVIDIFKFPGTILIQQMHKSGILRFNEVINDMTFFSKFKWSSKGPHSLGRKNSNNISAKYRSVHPSFLGQFDLISCGNSDPGTSGILSPFAKIRGLYFNSDGEPDEFMEEFMTDLKSYMKTSGQDMIAIDFTNKDEYYRILEKAEAFTEENLTLYAVPIDKPVIIFKEEEILRAEHEPEEKKKKGISDLIDNVDDGSLLVTKHKKKQSKKEKESLDDDDIN